MLASLSFFNRGLQRWKVLGTRSGFQLVQLSLGRLKLSLLDTDLASNLAIVHEEEWVTHLDVVPLLDKDVDHDARNVRADRDILPARLDESRTGEHPFLDGPGVGFDDRLRNLGCLRSQHHRDNGIDHASEGDERNDATCEHGGRPSFMVDVDDQDGSGLGRVARA